MNRQAGFSLLEVIIAVGVMSVGLSGICALLIASAAGMSSVSQQATAAWLAARLQAERSLTPDATEVLLVQEPVNPVCPPGASCLPVEFAQQNYLDWQSVVSRSLRSGQGLLCRDATPGDGKAGAPACDESGNWVIKIFWQDGGGNRQEWSRFTAALKP